MQAPRSSEHGNGGAVAFPVAGHRRDVIADVGARVDQVKPVCGPCAYVDAAWRWRGKIMQRLASASVQKVPAKFLLNEKLPFWNYSFR